jgi:hypothetical protein
LIACVKNISLLIECAQLERAYTHQTAITITIAILERTNMTQIGMNVSMKLSFVSLFPHILFSVAKEMMMYHFRYP